MMNRATYTTLLTFIYARTFCNNNIVRVFSSILDRNLSVNLSVNEAFISGL